MHKQPFSMITRKILLRMLVGHHGRDRKALTGVHRFDSYKGHRGASWYIHFQSPPSPPPSPRPYRTSYPFLQSSHTTPINMCYEPGGLWCVGSSARPSSVSFFSQRTTGSSN